MRTVLGLLAALVTISACDKTTPTPAGTVVVDIPSIPQLTVSEWRVGAPRGPMTNVEKTYRYAPGSIGREVRFKVSFEHGPLELVAPPKPGKPEDVSAPRAIRLEVLANDQWAITGKCEDTLAVPLAVNADGTSAYPKAVWARCMLVMKRKNGDITTAPLLSLHGDGRLETTATGPGSTLVEE